MSDCKKGFTLAEIMVVMVIMAVIIAAFAINNPFAPKYQTLYYYTFKNMKRFAGEVVGGALNAGSVSSLNLDDTNFCSKFTQNLNTVGGGNACATVTTATMALPYQGLVANSPSFTLSNGQRFYVSGRTAGTPGYRIVSVDLNGLSNPNATDKDIVPFIVYDTGEVVPLGAPINDKKYLAAYINTYHVDSGALTTTYVLDGSSKQIMTFRDGFCRSGAISNSAASSTTYCSGAPAIAVDSACIPGTTFCRLQISKPLIYVKI